MATPRTRTPLRRTTYVLLWIMVPCWALFTAWRWFGPDLAWPIVVAVSFTPYIAVATILPIALAVWLRAIRLLTILVLCVCALLVVLVPRAIGNGDTVPDGPKLRVMSVNLLTGGAGLDTVADLVAENKVDVLSVQEMSEDTAKALSSSKVGDQLPHQLLKPADKAAGTGILSRHELTENEKLSADGLFYNPAATLDVPKAGKVDFVAVHPSPPLNPERTRNWKADLRALPRADEGAPPRILAGDFNATLDHKVFAELLDSGYTDTAEHTGSGLTGTWPADKLLPRITLDHILTSSDITPAAYSVHTVPGSDHRAITATLSLPEPKD